MSRLLFPDCDSNNTQSQPGEKKMSDTIVLIPLAEAIHPNCHRDQCGVVGEALCKLAGALVRRLPEMPQVPTNVSRTDLWRSVNAAVTGLEAEVNFRAVHWQALACLEQNAVKTA